MEYFYILDQLCGSSLLMVKLSKPTIYADACEEDDLPDVFF